MKHFLILLFFIVLGYIAWHVVDKRQRRKALDFIFTHGLRLGLIFGVVLFLLLASFYLPSAGFFF